TMELEVLEHSELAVEGVALGHHADHLLGESRLPDDVDTAHICVAARRRHPCREHADRGALPGAVRAEESVDLAAADLDVERVHGLETTGIDLAQGTSEDDGVARRATAQGRFDDIGTHVAMLADRRPHCEAGGTLLYS